MKNILAKSLLFVFFSAIIVSCQPTLDAPKPDPGSAIFTKYVSLGDGVAGGYSDGALHLDGQLNAFPNILAQQFKLVGGGDFIQPLVAAGPGYGFENGKASTRLLLREYTFCDGTKRLYAIESGVRTINEIKSFPVLNKGACDNIAAQGARVIYFNKSRAPGGWNPLKPLGGADTYWSKMESSITATMLGDAINRNPTFFTILIGNTDVLRYAKSGGNQENPGANSDDIITPLQAFHDSLESVVKTLRATGANGAIANLTDLNTFPYFTKIKYDDLILTSAQATSLNTYYAGRYTFKEGRNAYVIEDSTALDGHRQILKGEYLRVEIKPDSTNLTCTTSPKWGSYEPLAAKWVLDASEIATINSTIISYNLSIKEIADKHGLAFVDLNESAAKNNKGDYNNGIKISTEFASGGIASLDGLNQSQRSHVLIANSFIKAINSKFGATIPYANTNYAPGVSFK